MIKNLHFLRFSFLMVLGLFAFASQGNAQCDAGTLVTTGTVNVPTGTTYDLMVMDSLVPAGGGYGWVFDNTNSDGMGALGGQFILFGQTGTESFDDDLNGLLSQNNLPLFTGTWVITGAVYTDPMDAFNSICSTTMDSLIVIFDEAAEVECYAGELQTFGEQVVCALDSFELVTVNDTISAGGALGWLFLTNGTGTGALDGDFILTGVDGMDFYDSDLNGILSANNLPEFEDTWVIKAATYTSTADPFNTICSVSEDSLTVTFNPAITGSIVNNFNTSLTVAPVGGTGPYSYLWSNGDTDQTTTGDLMDGTMTVVITDANDCQHTESVELMNTAVEDIEGLLNFGLSPNPTSGITRMELGFEEAQSVRVNVVGMDGKILQTVVNERTVGGVYNLDVSGFNTGVYLVHITTDSGHFAERLFVR